MVLGLRCYSPARRPHPASLSVRVPALAHLLAASFSLALTGSALQFSYRYSHQFGRVHFIPLVLAHAGHTSAAVLCRFSLPQRSCGPGGGATICNLIDSGVVIIP